MKNNFLILGNSVSGTSLLQSLMNHHPGVECKFEFFKHKKDIEGSIESWIADARAHSKIWGNKIPMEQFFTNEWKNDDIVSLVDFFKIIFIQRRFSRYAKQYFLSSKYIQWWERANHEIYWAMKEKDPENIINVSFEDLCLRPVIELTRICRFLKIAYKKEMLKGTVNNKSRLKREGVFDLTRV